MPWGQFLTYIVQALILLAVFFVVSAVVAGIVQAMRGQ
jgi:hypothetical protein